MLVREIMTSPAVTVARDTRIIDALGLVAGLQLSDLPVVDEDGRVVGMVSEIDLIRLAVAPDPRSRSRSSWPGPADAPMLVHEVMTAEPYTVSSSADVSDVTRALDLMRWKSVPVVDDGVLVGLLSRSDIVRALVSLDHGVGYVDARPETRP